MYLRTPIPNHCRAVSVTRYSTEEQRRQTCEDQHEYCREFLSDQGVTPRDFRRISDEGISGELRDRPGIQALRAGVLARDFDLIICEDSSRLFRGIGPCVELVGLAVDHDIRVICINDGVDTTDEDWDQRLEEAQRHHGRDNYFTRYRIRRSHDGLWRSGAAIGLLRPGYLRTRQSEADLNSPKYDEIDPHWIETIKKAFQMVADGDSPQTVADFLTGSGLPKTSNSSDPAWTEKNVISLVRCTKYRGYESRRQTISRKQYTTGKSISIRNPDPKNVQHREMPHLRIVDDVVWYAANRMIDDRRRKQTTPCGREHPLFGVPRDSRSPLSNLFVCGACGAKMHMCGRNEGGYRCSRVRRGECWNRTTSLRDLTHGKIGAAVSRAILEASESAIDDILDHLRHQIEGSDQLDHQEAELRKRQADLRRRQDRLSRAIQSEEQTPEFLSRDIAALESERQEIESDLRSLRSLRAHEVMVPGKQELCSRLHAAANEFSLDSREGRDRLCPLLAEPIRAIPCRQFGTDKVVLRAEIKLNLVALVPGLVRIDSGLIAGGNIEGELLHRLLTVDLFKPAVAPKHAINALRIYEQDLGSPPTLNQIGEALGISKRSAHVALQLGRQLREAGRVDPYEPLHSCPENVPRWKMDPAA
ncbi:MAG: recombinase family protein [Planctomycetaceae bacterium]|nr:recombinase family protein [Planctomycetaceae bacterium]